MNIYKIERTLRQLWRKYRSYLAMLVLAIFMLVAITLIIEGVICLL